MTKELMNWALIIFSTFSIVRGQSDNNISKNLSVDSVKFKVIQNKLDGCWKTKFSQFKYNKENNFGGEYKSRTHSSAPIFSLKIKANEIYIEWIELTGGESLIKIKKINKNRLIVENEKGKKFVYKRNKTCS